MNRLLRSVCCLLVGLCVVPFVPAADPASELSDFERELLRYIYRWHFDAGELVKSAGDLAAIEIWNRDLPIETDPGDDSRFWEYVIPLADVQVVAKQADYPIEHSDQRVRNASPRVIEVSYRGVEGLDRADFAVASYDFADTIALLNAERHRTIFPDRPLLHAIARQAGAALLRRGTIPSLQLEGEHTIYIAPLSPVVNEVWLFWTNFNCLLRFSSDADLNQAMNWNQMLQSVEVFDLPDSVIVVPGEVGPSNAYITKDFAGRVLFNCVILGERLVLTEVDLEQGTAASSGAP